MGDLNGWMGILQLRVWVYRGCLIATTFQVTEGSFKTADAA